MAFTQKEQVALNELTDLSAPIVTSTMPRWQRKALQAKSSTPATPASTKRKTRPATAATPASVKRSKDAADRFIPNRAAMDLDAASHSVLENKPMADAASTAAGAAAGAGTGTGAAAGAGSGDAATSHRVLAFTSKAPAPSEDYTNSLKVLYTAAATAPAKKIKVTRHIPTVPDRILDAPDLVDDYYLNLLDWNVSNVLAVALGPTVYLWNAASGSIEELMHTTAEDDFVCSLSWMKEGSGDYLAVGTNNAGVMLWDATKLKQVRSMPGHAARVGSLDWNQHVLSSGSRDTNIFHHDVRVRDHHIGTMSGHTQEVCGLKWSPDGTSLATGSNDNTLCIWDNVTSGVVSDPRHRLTQHQAAVKALAWCPWQRGTLASGGGTADRCIKFWNASTGAMLNSIDTGSQVCSLKWSTHEKEILSSHGFSKNQLCLWKYPSMAKVKELTGHTARVLHMAASPDGSTVCSAGADETLRFWRVFGEAKAKDKTTSRSAVLQGRSIR